MERSIMHLFVLTNPFNWIMYDASSWNKLTGNMIKMYQYANDVAWEKRPHPLQHLIYLHHLLRPRIYCYYR